jgi:hypothetical protein
MSPDQSYPSACRRPTQGVCDDSVCRGGALRSTRAAQPRKALAPTVSSIDTSIACAITRWRRASVRELRFGGNSEAMPRFLLPQAKNTKPPCPLGNRAFPKPPGDTPDPKRNEGAAKLATPSYGVQILCTGESPPLDPVQTYFVYASIRTSEVSGRMMRGSGRSPACSMERTFVPEIPKGFSSL